jgi:ArsR family transcriptional regulator, arsenate/arsenite/antimonite-responsive transcriptional repressor
MRAKPVPKRTECPTDADHRDRPVADTATADTDLAALAWAVAHPARVRILRILIARKACVCGELVDQMPLAQSTVSQHLKILKEAGLVQGEIDGPKVCYCVNADGLARLKALVGGL